MRDFLRKTVVKILRKTADKIDAGNSELTEEEAMEIAAVFCHEALSKAQACAHLNIGRSRFDELIREGKIPRGKKRKGYKELCWYRDELDKCKKVS